MFLPPPILIYREDTAYKNLILIDRRDNNIWNNNFHQVYKESNESFSAYGLGFWRRLVWINEKIANFVINNYEIK